jgi:hypothetical protein
MADLLYALRGMTDAGTADYTVGTANFWDDAQLQAVLDEHRVDEERLPLRSVVRYTGGGGSIEYKEHLAGRGWWEKTTGGTTIFVVEQSDGTRAGTADYSVDYQRGVVTFGADQRGTAYYLTGRRYRVHAAAASVWRRKAGAAAKRFAFSTDGHSMQRQQFHEHCLTMASHYDSLEPDVTVLTVRRGDTDG